LIFALPESDDASVGIEIEKRSPDQIANAGSQAFTSRMHSASVRYRTRAVSTDLRDRALQF
jgi:hypothetical protein